MSIETLTSSVPAATSALDLAGLLLMTEAWAAEALCAQTDPEMFCPDAKSREDARSDAKQVCGNCPVRQDCLVYALTHNEPYGVWGGLTPAERRKLRVSQTTPEAA